MLSQKEIRRRLYSSCHNRKRRHTNISFTLCFVAVNSDNHCLVQRGKRRPGFMTILLAMVLMVIDTRFPLSCSDAFLLSPLSTTPIESQKRRTTSHHAFVRQPSTTMLYISSIRTWFSYVTGGADDDDDDNSSITKHINNSNNNIMSMFFKRPWSRNNNKNNKNQTKKMPLSNDNRTNNNDNVSTGAEEPATTWATLLHDSENDDPTATERSGTWQPPNTVNETAASSLSNDHHRQVLQDDFLSNTTSSLLHFPEYTSASASAWAHTLSTTLQNTTSNAWNKVAGSAPLPMVLGQPSQPQSNHKNQTTDYPPIHSVHLAIPSHLRPNDTLTVADLQNILRQSGYVVPASNYSTTWMTSPTSTSTEKEGRGPLNKKRSQVGKSKSTNHFSSSSSSNNYNHHNDDDDDDDNDFNDAITPNHALAAPVSSFTNKNDIPWKTKQGVAFPQASVLNYKSLQRGTTVASGLLGMIIATTLWPNLWLMGIVVGAVYGHDLCSRPEQPPPSHLLARTLIGAGRKLARVTLQYLDSCRTLWFLYKTGELSYQYYKRYEAMDRRFAIQAKMDAWNARFLQGKQQFDQWERDNEIGRTVLAGLRTIWLVDERSKRRIAKNRKRTSRYRLIQSMYDVYDWILRRFRKMWKWIESSDWIDQWKDYLRGIRLDWSTGGQASWGARIGAVMATLVTVYVTGAILTITSPTLLAVLAIGIGIAWPSWISELWGRLEQVSMETRARGRNGGDNNNNNDGTTGRREETSSMSFLKTTTQTARWLGRYDKSRYHYFKRQDGSKRYYRTGQSLFRAGRQGKSTINETTSKNKAPSTFSWPWTKPQRTRRPPAKEQWGLLSSK